MRKPSCRNHGEVVLHNGNPLKGIRRVYACNLELHPDTTPAFRECHPIGKRFHHKNTIARNTFSRQTTIACVVETLSLVGNLHIHPTTTCPHCYLDFLGGVTPISMDYGIFYRLQHRHTYSRIVPAHITLGTKMVQTLLDLWDVGNIRLYNNSFCHHRMYCNNSQKYKNNSYLQKEIMHTAL